VRPSDARAAPTRIIGGVPDDDPRTAVSIGGPLGAAETVADDTRPSATGGGVFAAGTMVGRYRIEACLGAGGMGIVYRARDTELDRAIALKLVKPQGDAEQLAARLRRESRLQARAAHRSVITVHDIGRDEEQVFVAMELIEGATLRAWLELAPRGWREILDVFREAGDGLAAAHGAGLVHRDFKPDNALVELREGRVVRVLVSDFGVARALGDAETLQARRSRPSIAMTATGALIGTPAYMSPEQLDGEPADARADVFSFCVALWEALYGARPFPGESLAEIVSAFSRVPQPAPGARAPRWIAAVLRAGLVIERDRRTPSMPRLLEALDWRRRRARRWIVTSAATLIAVGGTAALAFGLGREPAICDARSAVGADVARAGGRLADVLARDSPELATHWRDAAATYERVWARLRARACAAREELHARCLDRLGAEAAAHLEAARVADPVRRGDMLRTTPLIAPRECLSPAAAVLIAAYPDDPTVRRARHVFAAIRGAWHRDPAAVPALLDEARELVSLAPLELLRVELAMYKRGFTNDATEVGDLRSVAQAADRAGHYTAAAWAWLEAISGLESDRAALAATDGALVRAGDPARLRALWHLKRSAVTAFRDRETAREAIATARALLAEVEAPYDLVFEHTVALALRRVDDHAGAEERLVSAIAFARLTGVAGPYLTWLRNNRARGLYWLGRTTEADAEVAALLAGVDPARPLPDEELVGTIDAHAEALSWSDPQRLIEHLERWDPALDATLARDSVRRASLEHYRALALASLDRFADAERSARRALELYLQHSGAASTFTAQSRMLLGQILIFLNKLREAEDQLARGIADLEASSSPDDPRVAQGRYFLAKLLLRLDRPDGARAAAELALRVYERSPQMSPGERGEVRWTIAQTLRTTDPERERELVKAALDDWTSDPASYRDEIAAARQRLPP
jgi:eukaryotic-like serine/threonine-protein kinase